MPAIDARQPRWSVGLRSLPELKLAVFAGGQHETRRRRHHDERREVLLHRLKRPLDDVVGEILELDEGVAVAWDFRAVGREIELTDLFLCGAAAVGKVVDHRAV